MTPETLQQLSQFCQLANREIYRYYGSRGSCIFSAATVCEVLTHFGFQAKPLRVEAGLFHDDRKYYGCVLGSSGDGTRRPAAGKDMWAGHLATLLDGIYLIDTTLDQANEGQPWLEARAIVIDLRTTKWFDPNPPWRGFPWTGLLRPWNTPVQLRVTQHHRHAGFLHAGDFRPSRRREIVKILTSAAAPIFK